jgi:hypothetical protein
MREQPLVSSWSGVAKIATHFLKYQRLWKASGSILYYKRIHNKRGSSEPAIVDGHINFGYILE